MVAEREGRLREAEASVAASLASSQTIVGPILERDCAESWEATQGEGKDRKTVTERRAIKLAAAPAQLDIDASAAIEPRHRGIFALATSAPQQAADGAPPCVFGDSSPVAAGPGQTFCIETFGVAFIDPVNPYTLSDRATKYGLLFIALTFVGVAAVEVLRRVRVHPLQYLLVGGALAVFFLLLVSLREHLPFAIAYLVASAACTALLAFYGRFVLQSRRAGLAFGAAIGVLYAVLYVLLQLEQTALLLGSGLLFAVIAALMIATRGIDWYALFARLRSDASAPEPSAS